MLVKFSWQIITMKFTAMMIADSVHINSVTQSSPFFPLLLFLIMNPPLYSSPFTTRYKQLICMMSDFKQKLYDRGKNVNNHSFSKVVLHIKFTLITRT